VSRPSNDLLQLGGRPSVGGPAALQPSYFQPSGISGPAAPQPTMMPSAGMMAQPVPFQGNSFPSAVPPTQPFPAAVQPTQQTFPSAMQQAGSYPLAASSVGSYLPAASYQPVPLQPAAATSIHTTSASVPQISVSFCNKHLVCFYRRPLLWWNCGLKNLLWGFSNLWLHGIICSANRISTEQLKTAHPEGKVR